MTHRDVKKILFFSLLTLTLIFRLYADDWAISAFTPGVHRGAVNAIVYKGDIIISAGEDGFLQIWNTGTKGKNAISQAAGRFQVSEHSIIAMAERPNKDEVCIVESDGMGSSRVSVWNYKTWKNVFSLPLNEPITSVYYSMSGKNILACGRTGMSIFDSSSGMAVRSPQSLTGNVSLAVTGKTERSMLVYVASGVLSYWDLQSGNETNHFNVPANLRFPVLFGNSLYLAGINADGLTIINAVSGELFSKDNSILSGSLLYTSGADLYCMVQKSGTEIYRYSIDRAGQLNKQNSFSINEATSKVINEALSNAASNAVSSAVSSAVSNATGRFTAIAINGDSIALGSSNGTIAIARNGQVQQPSVKEQINIFDADVSGTNIAFLSENGAMGFIPLNYTQLSAGKKINIETGIEAYNRITAFNSDEDSGQFVLWQNKRTGANPVIRSSGNSEIIELGSTALRAPIHSAASFGGKVLFQDSTGNISIITVGSESRPFTFFSVGLMDAAFMDRNRLLLGRSAVSGNAPFIILNVATGETVPLHYQGEAIVNMHRGASGNIYAAVVSGSSTSIVRLDPGNMDSSVKYSDYDKEETYVSLTEISDKNTTLLAAFVPGKEAAIYSNNNTQKLDRTAGLPRKIINGGQHLICLDGDGGICWHDTRNGKILAVFRLHPDGWTLQTEKGSIKGGY